MKKTAIIISSDFNSKCLASMFLNHFDKSDYFLIEDNSMTFKKIFKLLHKRRIGVTWLIKQFWSSQLQKRFLKKKQLCNEIIAADLKIESHRDLAHFIKNHPEINVIFAFRAGVILQKSLLLKLRCINTHYASLPEFGGLGAISKALQQKAYQQNVSIHEMEDTIDSGAILYTKSYILDPEMPYWKNEINAALTGVQAAKEYLAANLLSEIKTNVPQTVPKL